MHLLKRIGQMLCVGLVLLLSFHVKAMGIELLSEKEAFTEMFPEADNVTPDNRKVNQDQTEKIKKRLGGKIVHYQEGSNPKEIKDVVFYVASKNGKKTSVGLIVEQPGKWGPVKYMIVVDPEKSNIQNLTIMSYTEKRGRPIARRNFLKQFIGKSSLDPIAVSKDINGISGATISSDATCFAVKLTLALYEEVYLSK
jgi:Na+-translocating ferredoxin:NAD+ oxidoreductase RnfG subunit